MKQGFLILIVIMGVNFFAINASAGPELVIYTGETQILTRVSLEDLPHHVVRTSTPWTSGITEFQGVLLRELPGVDGQSDIEVEALNGYTARIPAGDIKDLDTILAYKINGTYPSVREKGPFWVIYPRDNLPNMSRQLLDMRMVWQVQRIKVAPDGN